MKRLSVSSFEMAQKKKRTKREVFLGEIDGVVPWARLEALISPFYTKPRRGRPQMVLAVMLGQSVVFRYEIAHRRGCEIRPCPHRQNRHDAPLTEDLIRPDDVIIFGPSRACCAYPAAVDKGYASVDRKKDMRAKVEHAFRVLKCQFGYRKVRHHGLAKNRAQLFTLVALSNLYTARKRLRAESV